MAFMLLTDFMYPKPSEKGGKDNIYFKQNNTFDINKVFKGVQWLIAEDSEI